MSYTYFIYWSRCLTIWALEPIIWKFKELMGWNSQMRLIWTTKQKVCLSLYKRTKSFTNQAKKVYQKRTYMYVNLISCLSTLSYQYLILFSSYLSSFPCICNLPQFETIYRIFGYWNLCKYRYSPRLPSLLPRKKWN